MKTNTYKLSTHSNCLAIVLILFTFLALSAPLANAAKTIAVTGNLSFGSVAVGSTAQQSMTISNAGNNTINVTGITYPAGFSGAFVGTIHARSAVNVVVTFAPTAVVNYNGIVTVASDATSGNNMLTASGTGTGPSIAILGSLAFGNVAAGGSSQLTITITNNGTDSLNVTSISYPAGFSGSFSGTIAAGSSQDVAVTFSPSAVANYSGTVTVNSSALAGVNTISASGVGTGGVIALGGTLSFGDVIEESSAQQSLTISNIGNASFTVSGISLPAGFSGSFSGTIAAGGSTNVTITFSPTDAIAYSGNVTVTSDAFSGGNTIGISGNGIAQTRIISLSSDLTFGSVPVGSSSQQILTVTNTGNSTLTITNILFPAGFSSDWTAATVAPGTTTNLTVTFSPIAVISYGGTITFESDATSGTNTANTSGVGLGTLIALGGNLSFGNVIVGASAQQTLIISNTGNSTLTVTNISLPAGFSGSFSGDIAAGDSTNVTITFSPTDTIVYGGTLTVTSDAFSGGNTIGISGNGIAQTRIISLSGDLNFGSVPVGSSSQQILTVTNTGNSTLTITNILFPAGFSSDWTAATVAPGTTTNLTVTFSPIAVISYGGTITFESDATSGTNTVSANASGVGLGALIGLGGNLSFGNVIVGASAQQTLTISNTGNSTLTVTNISFPTGFSGSFSGDIAAGDSTNVTITFSPTDTIVYGGTVTVASDAINGVNTALASGTGIAQTRIAAVSGDLNFGNVAVGSSNQLTLTITNIGNWTLTITNVSYPNGFSGDFTNGLILSGAITNITVTFAPTAITNYSGPILIGSDQTDGTNGATASGIGTGPLIAVGGNLDFGNVTVGTSAQQTLIISNTGNSTLTVASISYPAGFSGAFTGTIEGGASTNVTVTFSPSAAIAYGGTVTVNSDALGGNNTIAASGTGVAQIFHYTPAKAKFNGLFFPTNDVEFTNSGNITISVNQKGKFTAHLRLAGKQFPFTGTFAADGSASGNINRKGLNPLSITLQVGDNGDVVTGTLSDGNWTAQIMADRATFKNKVNPAPQAGVYSLIIAGSNDASVAPAANSTGTATVSTGGLVTINETLGDGTHMTQSTAISKDGQIPFFGSLYGGKGSILGWLSVTNAAISGDVDWFKQPVTGTTNYPNGFSLETTASGVKQ